MHKYKYTVIKSDGAYYSDYMYDRGNLIDAAKILSELPDVRAVVKIEMIDED